MSEACFDPNAAVGLWTRMAQEEQYAPPQFLSTHPSSHNRVDAIREWLPQAQQKSEQVGRCARSQTECLANENDSLDVMSSRDTVSTLTKSPSRTQTDAVNS